MQHILGKCTARDPSVLSNSWSHSLILQTGNLSGNQACNCLWIPPRQSQRRLFQDVLEYYAEPLAAQVEYQNRAKEFELLRHRSFGEQIDLDLSPPIARGGASAIPTCGSFARDPSVPVLRAGCSRNGLRVYARECPRMNCCAGGLYGVSCICLACTCLKYRVMLSHSNGPLNARRSRCVHGWLWRSRVLSHVLHNHVLHEPQAVFARAGCRCRCLRSSGSVPMPASPSRYTAQRLRLPLYCCFADVPTGPTTRRMNPIRHTCATGHAARYAVRSCGPCMWTLAVHGAPSYTPGVGSEQ